MEIDGKKPRSFLPPRFPPHTYTHKCVIYSNVFLSYILNDLQIYKFITSWWQKDVCSDAPLVIEQLVQMCVCVCVWSMSVHTSGCSFDCRQRGRSFAPLKKN